MTVGRLGLAQCGQTVVVKYVHLKPDSIRQASIDENYARDILVSLSIKRKIDLLLSVLSLANATSVIGKLFSTAI